MKKTIQLSGKFASPYHGEVLDLVSRLELSQVFALNSVDDGGEELIPVFDTPRHQIADTICGVDEARLYLTKRATGKRRMIWIVLGNNPGELCADWTDDADLGEIITKHSTDWSK